MTNISKLALEQESMLMAVESEDSELELLKKQVRYLASVLQVKLPGVVEE